MTTKILRCVAQMIVQVRPIKGHDGEKMITHTNRTLVRNCESLDRLARRRQEPFWAHTLAIEATLEARNAHPT